MVVIVEKTKEFTHIEKEGVKYIVRLSFSLDITGEGAVLSSTIRGIIKTDSREIETFKQTETQVIHDRRSLRDFEKRLFCVVDYAKLSLEHYEFCITESKDLIENFSLPAPSPLN